MKIVQLWTCVYNFSFSFSLGPLLVVLGGLKYRPAALQHDTISQNRLAT